MRRSTIVSRHEARCHERTFYADLLLKTSAADENYSHMEDIILRLDRDISILEEALAAFDQGQVEQAGVLLGRAP